MDDNSLSTVRPSDNASLVDLNHINGATEKTVPTVAPGAAVGIHEPPRTSYTAAEKTETTAELEKDALEKHDEPQLEDDIQYPAGVKLLIISLALCLAVFLVALVRYDPYMVLQALLNVSRIDFVVTGSNHHRDGHSTYHRPLQGS